MTMFQINEKDYELKFNMKRVELMEQRLGEGGVPRALLASDGMLSIAQCKTFFAFGLKEAGSDTFLAPAKATELFEQYLEEKGFTEAISRIYEEAQASLGFLFRVG